MHLGFNQQKGLSGSSFFWHQPQLDVLQFVFFLYQAWALGQRIQLKPAKLMNRKPPKPKVAPRVKNTAVKKAAKTKIKGFRWEKT
jgi:hypothetical protein